MQPVLHNDIDFGELHDRVVNEREIVIDVVLSPPNWR